MKPLFNRDQFPGLRALVFLILSVVLMVLNHQTTVFNSLRSQLSLVVFPIQMLVDKPVQFFNWLGTSITGQQAVLNENAHLRSQQLLLEAKLQKLLVLEEENEQLRRLVSSSSQFSFKTTIAQLLAVSSDPLRQQITLDKGNQDGIYAGQPVLDAYGVMGQVIEVTPFASQVMLISDIQSAIPVQNTRNGIRSVVAGSGYSGQLNLLNVAVTTDVAVGDVLVTSGLGGRFPFGYPVGQVVSIKQNPEERFAVITVKPSAHLNSSRQVILLWPDEKKQPVVTDKHKAVSVRKAKGTIKE